MELFKREYDLVKFVNVNGEYRFCHSDANHKDQVKEGEKATSAGFIAYDTEKDGKKFFRIPEDWSSTLTLGPNREVDGPAIAAVLGFEYKLNWYET
jgi:hypothetical protein